MIKYLSGNDVQIQVSINIIFKTLTYQLKSNSIIQNDKFRKIANSPILVTLETIRKIINTYHKEQ